MSVVIPLLASMHRQVDRLLPWYVNGTLDPGAREQVENHLAACARCRHEAGELRQLQRACADPPAWIASSPALPAFERLRGRLSGESHGRPLPRSPAWLAAAWSRAAPALRWATAPLLASLALGLLLAAPRLPVATYHTLGDPLPRVRMPSLPAEARLVVVFDPQLSEARMRVLLRASGARIIDGPSEAGAYVLGLPGARVEAVQAALRSAPGVLLVQRLDGVAAR